MTQITVPVFQQTLNKTNQWLSEIAERLNWTDRKRAWTALRAVLHTLRDQLSIEESTDLSAQLPMLIRGLYFEGWNPSKQTPRIRKIDEFTERVNRHFVEMDITDWLEPEDICRAVFAVLAEHVSKGEIEDVISSLPQPLKELW